MFQLQANQKDLLHALQSVAGVVDKKNTIPVLSNVLLTPGQGTATVTGTNLEIGKVVTFAATCPDQATALTLPEQTLREILREAPPGPITLTEQTNGWCVIECGTSHFRIAGLPPTDFPEPGTTILDSVTVTLSADALTTVLAQTAFAVSHDESRYALTGLLFEVGPETLRTIATDGHRLAISTVACLGAEPVTVICPAKAVAEIQKDAAGEVVITIGTTQAAFAWPGAQLFTRLIDGSFPEYAAIIPKSGALLHIKKAEFVAALRRVALLCGESKLIRLDITREALTLSASDPQAGEAHETIPATWNGATPLAIGFNARYLLDGCAIMPGETISLLLSEGLAPGLMADGEVSYIIMPMRI